MSDKKLKVVIVDNDKDRRENIKSILPSYTDSYVSDFGSMAQAAIRIDTNGRIPDLVIIYGEDGSGQGISTFDWMRNKEPGIKSRYIPVIVLVEDEFSDSAVQFLEIDDVFFYEGEIEEDRLFSTFIEAIESENPNPIEEEEPAFEEKSAERIMGLSVSAPAGSEDKPQRVAVLDKETRMANLRAALERGREKAEEIRAMVAESKGETYVRKYTAPKKYDEPATEDQPSKPQNITSTSWDLDDIPEEFRLASEKKNREYNLDDIPEEFRLESEKENKVSRPVYSSGGVYIKPRKKPSVVVVDDDAFVRKIFGLYLGDAYEVVPIESGIKAVDYFTKNTADIMFLDAVMPGLSPLQVINSIRWQKNGRNLPIVYLCGNDFTGDRSTLKGNNIYGVLPKPLSKGTLLTAIDQLKPYIGSL